MNQMRFASMVVALLSLLSLGASRASASIVQYQLTSDHCTAGGGCLPSGGSAGTITVTDISGGVTINVSLASGFKFMGQGGQGGDFGFNLIGNPTIAGSSSPNNCGATGTSPCYTLNSTTAG